MITSVSARRTAAPTTTSKREGETTGVSLLGNNDRDELRRGWASIARDGARIVVGLSLIHI
eukprot:13594835-Alexandrium_andersonii.AAC.1